MYAQEKILGLRSGRINLPLAAVAVMAATVVVIIRIIEIMEAWEAGVAWAEFLITPLEGLVGTRTTMAKVRRASPQGRAIQVSPGEVNAISATPPETGDTEVHPAMATMAGMPE